MRLEIDLYGGLRELAPQGRLALDLDAGTGGFRTAALKALLVEKLAGHEALVHSSALATEDRVLGIDELVAAPAGGGALRLALLPPVNGG